MCAGSFCPIVIIVVTGCVRLLWALRWWIAAVGTADVRHVAAEDGAASEAFSHGWRDGGAGVVHAGM